MSVRSTIPSNLCGCFRSPGTKNLQFSNNTPELTEALECTEEKPFCLRCLKAKKVCEGYEPPQPWLFVPYGKGRDEATDDEADDTVTGLDSLFSAALSGNSPAVPMPLAGLYGTSEEQRSLSFYLGEVAPRTSPYSSKADVFHVTMPCYSWQSDAVKKGLVSMSLAHEYITRVQPVQQTKDRAFQYYMSAIKALIKDKPTPEVILLTCLLMWGYEGLAGDMRTANTHLKGGLAVLDDTRSKLGSLLPDQKRVIEDVGQMLREASAYQMTIAPTDHTFPIPGDTPDFYSPETSTTSTSTASSQIDEQTPFSFMSPGHAGHAIWASIARLTAPDSDPGFSLDRERQYLTAWSDALSRCKDPVTNEDTDSKVNILLIHHEIARTVLRVRRRDERIQRAQRREIGSKASRATYTDSAFVSSPLATQVSNNSDAEDDNLPTTITSNDAGNDDNDFNEDTNSDDPAEVDDVETASSSSSSTTESDSRTDPRTSNETDLRNITDCVSDLIKNNVPQIGFSWARVLEWVVGRSRNKKTVAMAKALGKKNIKTVTAFT